MIGRVVYRFNQGQFGLLIGRNICFYCGVNLKQVFSVLGDEVLVAFDVMFDVMFDVIVLSIDLLIIVS